MKITTMKMPATDTEGARIRLRHEHGLPLDVPYNHGVDDPHEHAIRSVFEGVTSIERVKETARGYEWEVTR